MRGIAMDKEWQAEDDMRTLVRAEEIRKDPKRLKAAQAMAKKRADELKSLAPQPQPKK
ncbi:hypothetical protein N5C12_15380 [Comamonas aquatica]|uniref:hypothetical protein n=1 Tax=Comamonas aquatica TaxID=225991 RepID=UPI00244BA418|nr:hypothetical protein [Comamonas aquatica]MDH0900726.1 hypothetical protein [Comamonas aquatica]